MPFRELSPLHKEMYLRQQIEALSKLYHGAQVSLRNQLRKLDLTDFQRHRAQALLKQVNSTVAVLDRGAYRWAQNALPQAYERGIDLAGERLKAMKVARFVSYDAQIHTSAVNALMNDVTVELIMANDSMKKFFTRTILQTQQSLLQDAEISRLIAKGVLEGQARRTVSDTILKELRGKMNNDQFIVINGRNYRPDKYAELVARTRTREASSQGTINTALRYDVDLVQWDAHAEICEYCQQFSGRVYSISGEDNDFPMLTEKPPLHPNSYDKKTEIYTRSGWQKVKDVKVGDSCLSLNPNNFNLEWVEVKRLFNHKEKKMISFKSRNFDLLVTPNHDMFYMTDWNYKHNKEKLKFVKAEKLLNKKSGAFYRSSKWHGESFEEDIVLLGNIRVSIELYAEFMGWYLSEGSCVLGKGRNYVSISQSKNVNLDKYEKIELLLKRIGFNFRKTNSGFVISSKSLSGQMAKYGKCDTKFVPSSIKSASKEIIRIFLDAFNLGDGSIKDGKFWKGGKFNNEKTYFTSSKRLADDIGELLLKVGKRPSFYLKKSKGKAVKHKNGNYVGNFDVWVIRECQSQYSTLNNLDITEINYNDYTYCVELEKNHTLWVRRNGKTSWCGNCRCVIMPVTREALQGRGYLDEVIKLSNAPSIEIDSFSRFEEVLSQL